MLPYTFFFMPDARVATQPPKLNTKPIQINQHHQMVKYTTAVTVNQKTSLVLKYAPCYANVWVNGGIAPNILNLGTRWR
jgi:hypothetical protein